MVSLDFLKEAGRRGVLGAVVLAGLAVPATVGPVSAAGLFDFGQNSQDSRDAAQLTLRIQNLEQQVRDLTGQVQGLQFQLTQMQTLIDRMNQDTDFRFKQLEGGKGGGAAPSGDQGSITPPVQPSRGQQTAAAAPMNLTGGDTGGTDGLGKSYDPLVGKGRPGAGDDTVPLGPANSDGTAYNPAGTRPPVQQASTGGSAVQPVSTGPAASNPQAQAQFKIGYQAIVKGDYRTAAAQFKSFIKQYPDDPQAADATNWLGEALLQQQDYVGAADVLVTGYKTYPSSPRAPDMLLKLGIALAAAQQQDAACKTFGLLAQKYPDTTVAFKTRLKQEMARGKCPA
ncbi:MAG: tol-pal system protein YbgF [Devosia sp.]